MKVNVNRLMKQLDSKNYKTSKLEVGTVVTVLKIEERSWTNDRGEDVPSDTLFCKTDSGKNIKIPLRDFMKFIVEDGELINYSSEDEEADMPTKFKISGSEDKTFDGSVVYPVWAYEGYDQFRDKNNKDYGYTQLLESGLKERKTGSYDPVQQYTIEVL